MIQVNQHPKRQGQIVQGSHAGLHAQGGFYTTCTDKRGLSRQLNALLPRLFSPPQRRCQPQQAYPDDTELDQPQTSFHHPSFAAKWGDWYHADLPGCWEASAGTGSRRSESSERSCKWRVDLVVHPPPISSPDWLAGSVPVN